MPVRPPAPLLALSLLPLLAPGLRGATRYFVDDDALPGGDGSSWASAFDELDEALVLLGVDDEVWVAAGRYVPDVASSATDPRTRSFRFHAAKVYGGFAGTESALEDRAGLFDQTILSGDLGFQGDASDNAYHTVEIDNPSGIPPSSTTLDGFTITEGNANGPGNDTQGGGVRCFNAFLLLRNCTIVRNQARTGGGLHAQPGGVHVHRVRFIQNHAISNGGAIWGHALLLRVYDSVFQGNVSDAKGGGFYINATAGDNTENLPKILFQNSLFHDNLADRGGGGFVGGGEFSYGIASLRNCTMAFNEARVAGGGISASTGGTYPADVRIHDSIVWRNSAPLDPNLHGRVLAGWSLVEGGYGGQSNIAFDPQFRDPVGRDLRLALGSPAIDAGKRSWVARDLFDADGDGNVFEKCPVDLDGNRRFRDEPSAPNTGVGNPPVDLGAYES